MIFLGAGASAPFEIPISSQLTEKLIKILSEEHPKLYEDIAKWLEMYYGYVDFENILKILYVLTDKNSINQDDRVHQFRIGYGRQGDYTELIDKMYRYIHDVCTNPFVPYSSTYISHIELENIFNKTYDAILGIPLKSAMGEIVFSTNYDPTVEFWCEKRNIYCMDGRMPNKNNPEFFQLHPSSMFNQTFPNQSFGDSQGKNIARISDKIPLIRLHGSVLSYRTKRGMGVKFNQIIKNLKYPDLYSEFINEHPQLIFPGYEDNVRIGHARDLYRFYEDQCKRSRKCLFIGYSFRHEVINIPIIENLIGGNIQQLGIFTPDPDKSLENLYRNPEAKNIPEDCIVKIKGKIGTEKGVDEFIDKWWSDAFTSKDVFYQDIENWVINRNEIYK